MDEEIIKNLDLLINMDSLENEDLWEEAIGSQDNSDMTLDDEASS